MMSLRQAILTIVLCLAGFGLAGAALGSGVGNAAPTFVKWVMGREFERSPNLDPAEFGLGFGLFAGLGFGAFVGPFLVLLLTLRDAWAVVWTRKLAQDSGTATPAKPLRSMDLE